jgi:hypothetical protein
MKVSKSVVWNKPGYPSHKQFLAALGIGAMAAASQAEAPAAPGVPVPEGKSAITNEMDYEEPRLPGDMMVEPALTAPVAPKPLPSCTNAVPPATNTVIITPPPVRLLGKPAAQ